MQMKLHNLALIAALGISAFVNPAMAGANSAKTADSGTTATLCLRGIPKTAIITINNTAYDQPLSGPLTLAPGSVQLSISSEGTQILKSFSVKAGDVKVINFSNNAEYASVDIISEPIGAEILIDERKKGQTPFMDSLVQPGFHVISIKRVGYNPVTREVNLLPQEELELSYELTRSKAWLDSISRAKVIKRQKRRFVQRLAYTAMGVACAGAAGYFEIAARNNITTANDVAQTYDKEESGFDQLRARYYDNRNAASKNIKRRDLSAELAGVAAFGFLLTFIF
jgi:hypothetical protein